MANDTPNGNGASGPAPAGSLGLRDIVAGGQPAPEEKRGRGRPKGSTKTPAPALGGLPSADPIIWSLDGSKALARVPFDIGAVLTGIKEISLTETEIEAIAPSLRECLIQFAPAAGAKYACVIALSSSLIGVGLAKVSILKKVKAEREAEAKKAKAEQEAAK